MISNFSTLSWILFVLLGIACVFQGLRKPKTFFWYWQSGILFLCICSVWVPKLRETPPTRLVLIDLSFSFQPRVLADLRKGSQSELQKVIRSFAETAPGLVGFGVFGRNFQMILPPTSRQQFLKNFLGTPNAFQEWTRSIDPSQTHLKMVEEELLKDFESLEILLFSDGQFSWNPSSEQIHYLPQTLEVATHETRILSFQGPIRASLKQGISLKVRVEGESTEERELRIFQEQQLLFRQKIRFTEEASVIDIMVSCPSPLSSGTVSYQAKLLPSEKEVLLQNNEKSWTVFFQEQKQILMVGPSSLQNGSSFFRALPYQVTFWTVPQLTGQPDQLRPFEWIGYFPGADPLPVEVQRAFCDFVQDGGGFLLFGNRWISQLTGQPLESILPVTYGGDPEKIAIRILLDCSGSMSELGEDQWSKLQLCTQALEQMMAQIPSEMLSFFDFQMWAVNDNAKQCSLEELRGFQARGKTYLGKGLQNIVFPASTARKLLLILSDGETQDAPLFIQQGEQWQREQIRLIALQLPHASSKGTGILNQFLGKQGVFIPIRSYSSLQNELWKIIDEEVQLYYRRGPFEVLQELPLIQGYARTKLRVDALAKQTIFSEPFLAFRPVKQGASAFFAVDPVEEGWTNSSRLDTFLMESLIKPLEQLKTPEVSYQSGLGTIRLFSKKKGRFCLRQEEKVWEFEPTGFGHYQADIPEKIQTQVLQIYQDERLIAVLPAETDPELQNLFIHYAQLMKLQSLKIPFISRFPYSPFFLYFVLVFLFINQTIKAFPSLEVLFLKKIFVKRTLGTSKGS